jgi:hypothetical protein
MANLAEAIERRDVLVGRLFANAIGAFDLFRSTSAMCSVSTGCSPSGVR